LTEEEQEKEEFIYHKYTYTSNFRLIHVSDGLPEKQQPSMPATHVNEYTLVEKKHGLNNTKLKN